MYFSLYNNYAFSGNLDLEPYNLVTGYIYTMVTGGYMEYKRKCIDHSRADYYILSIQNNGMELLALMN